MLWRSWLNPGQTFLHYVFFPMSPHCLLEIERMCLLSNVSSNHLKPDGRRDESGLNPRQNIPLQTWEDIRADRHLLPVFKKKIDWRERRQKETANIQSCWRVLDRQNTLLRLEDIWPPATYLDNQLSSILGSGSLTSPDF